MPDVALHNKNSERTFQVLLKKNHVKLKSLFGLAALFTVCLFARCKKEDCNTVFNVMFYTSTSNGPRVLSIDGSERGQLPFLSKAPVCGQQATDGVNPVMMQLRAGEYSITAKDAAGNARPYGVIKLGKSTMGVHGSMGGLSLSSNGDCVIVDVFE